MRLSESIKTRSRDLHPETEIRNTLILNLEVKDCHQIPDQDYLASKIAWWYPSMIKICILSAPFSSSNQKFIAHEKVTLRQTTWTQMKGQPAPCLKLPNLFNMHRLDRPLNQICSKKGAPQLAYWANMYNQWNTSQIDKNVDVGSTLHSSDLSQICNL